MKRDKYKRKKKMNERTIYHLLSFFMVLFSVSTFIYLYLPTFGLLFGLILVIVLGTMIVAPVVLTFGIVLISDEFRLWAKNTWAFINKFFNISENIVELSTKFLPIAYISIVLNVLVLLLSIIGRLKEKKRYIFMIVLSILFLILNIVWIILFINNNKQIIG